MRPGLLTGALLMALAGPPAETRADDLIEWHVFDFPPLFVLSPNTVESSGFGIAIQDRLFALLDEFRHVRHRTSLARGLALARSGTNICFVGPYWTPDREGFLTYSRPIFQFQSPMLALRRDTVVGEQVPQIVSLAHMLTEHGSRFGLPAGLSFGPEVDAIVEENAADALRLFGQNRYGQALVLLEMGRIDYTLMPPLAFTWIAQEQGFSDTLMQIPLMEAQELEVFALACSDTRVGHDVITTIDRLLEDADNAAEFEDIVLEWIDPRLHSHLRRRTGDNTVATP